ncbi:MAG: hypothetical protein V4505_25715 [Pseudomonadota bacterium]
MDYEEATEATVSRAEAKREIAKHGCDFAEFLDDVGDRTAYNGGQVLAWLGY